MPLLAGQVRTLNGLGVIIVQNYAALPAPATVSGKAYFVEDAQGSQWFPGSVGGTYYPAGTYYSNGVVWKYTGNPYQATQGTVDSGVVTDQFVSPATLEGAAKWGTKEDISNKSTSVTTDQASNTKYPSVKSVYDWATGLFATISSLTSGLALKLNLTGGSLSGAFNEAKSTNIAGGSTIDLATANGNTIHVTGSGWTAASLGTVQAGGVYKLIFDGVGTLTHSSNLKLPGLEDILTVAGDKAIVVSEGSGAFDVISYQTSVDDYIAYVPSHTGYSVNPIIVQAESLKLKGKAVNVNMEMSTGTSNATTKTITLPYVAQYLQRFKVYITNNGTATTGLLVTRAGSNIADYYVGDGSAFTGSGSARLSANFTYKRV